MGRFWIVQLRRGIDEVVSWERLDDDLYPRSMSAPHLAIAESLKGTEVHRFDAMPTALCQQSAVGPAQGDDFLWLASIIPAFKQVHAGLSVDGMTMISAGLVVGICESCWGLSEVHALQVVKNVAAQSTYAERSLENSEVQLGGKIGGCSR